MKKLMEKPERLAHTASLFAANVAAVILLALVALTCVDVVRRYFFRAPVVGGVELVRICMAGIIFFSFPYMFLRNDHIIVDLFAVFRRGYTGWIFSLLFLVLSMGIAIILGDRVMDYAVRAFEDGDRTEYLSIPRYIIVGFITASIFTAAAMCALRFLVILSKPGEDDEDDHGESV